MKIKAIDILKKANEIENTCKIISEPDDDHYGFAVRMTNDPQIQFMCIDSTSDCKDFKIGKKRYNIEKSVHEDVENIPKLIKALNELLEMEV